MGIYRTSGDFIDMPPREFRNIVRRGEWAGDTVNACRGYAMVNLAIVSQDVAADFLLFCTRNPQPCPVVDVTDPGSPVPKFLAPDADLRTDLPRYHVQKKGQIIDKPTDIKDYWRDDLVAFLLGCSGSFEWILQSANLEYRTIGAYNTSIPCEPAGLFSGRMVVTCRLFASSHDAIRAIQITSRHPHMHGSPVHIGDPDAIGIDNLYKPEYGPIENVAPQRPNEIALFWGCGLTPELIAREAKLPFMITHAPAHMFVTDKLSEELAIL